MTGKPSFYEATDRRRSTAGSWAKAKQQYSYNYATILPRHRNARILDLGCSEGIALEWLTDHGYTNVMGIDSDQVAIDHARKRLREQLSEKQILCDDAFEYLKKQEEGSVDRILMFNVVEHLEKPLLLNVLSEVRRVLKPGGAFLAQTGNIENPFNLGLFARDFTHQIPFTSNSLKQALLMSGFDPTMTSVKAVRYKTTLRNWPLQVAGPVAGWITKKVALAMRARIHETSSLIYCVAWR